MPQAVAHGGEAADGPVVLVGLGGAGRAVDRQPLQHACIEQPAQAVPAAGGDQSLFLVVAQGRGRYPGSSRDLAYVQLPHALDLKST
ncbi:hypothetical protein PGPR2_29210 [Pseudomonas aeruginosa PGPR2]|nr:hypothetical protein PGPR2_29210 [Pseudomonas aeruginosa PGPR2]